MQNRGISHFCAKFECLSFVGLRSNGQAGINEVQNRGISHFCANFECLSFVGLSFVGRCLGRSLAAWPEVVDRLEFGRRRTADPRLSVGEDAEPLGRAFLLATSSACPLLCLSFVVSFVGGSDDSWVSRVEALNRLDPCVDFVSNRRLSS